MDSQRAPSQITLTLDELLRLLEQGNFGLPDFQRPFQWNSDRVRSLLASIFMGWPAGLILLMEAPPSNFFAVRTLDGFSHQSPATFRHLVLDGQQRLTAIAQAFGLAQTPDRVTWFLDVRKFREAFPSGDIEDCFVRIAGNPDQKDGRALIPLRALRSAAAYQTWRDQDSARVFDYAGNASLARVESDALWVGLLRGVRTFAFPCTVLPYDMPLPAVAMIFERLNTAGLSLDTFDLVVAHVYKDGHNLRAIWDQELSARPILRRFSPDDPLVAAELVAMVRRGDTRRSGLLSLDPEVLWSSWREAIDALEAAARFLSDRAGISNESQLPHRGIYLSLAGAAFELGGLPTELDDLLLYWIVSRGLSERYNAAVNTRVVAEYKALVQAAAGTNELPILAPSREAIEGATRRANSSIWSTVQLLIRRATPVDYPDGLLSVPLSPEWSRPFSLLRGSQVELTDRAIGVVLGGPHAEKSLARMSLAEIGSDLRNYDVEQVNEYLESQILPDLDSPAWLDSERFIHERASLVLEVLRGLQAQSQRRENATATIPPTLAFGGTTATVDLLEDWLASVQRGQVVPRFAVAMRASEDLMNQGRPSEAAAALQLLLESPAALTASERLEIEITQARALLSARLFDEATMVLTRALREASNLDLNLDSDALRPAIVHLLGTTLLERGRSPEAVAVLQEQLDAIRRSTPAAPVLADLDILYARALLTAGDRGRAADVLRRTMESLPADPQAVRRETRLQLASLVEELTPADSASQ